MTMQLRLGKRCFVHLGCQVGIGLRDGFAQR